MKHMKTESKQLSKQAEKLLERVKQGRFYRPYGDRLPKAMAELEKAGLVTTTGRVVVIELAYVPTQGYTPYVKEKYHD